MAKLVERYGVMEDFEARTKSKLVDMIFNPDVSEDGVSSVKYLDVDVERITPRSVNKYSQGRIERLAKSIENTNNRLIHPIVLVKAEDLLENSKVLKQFIKQGIDPKKLDLVIVAGERRFRAWMLLREKEAERIKGEVGTVNRFNRITANILTKKEAAKEEVYYEDSNLEARQLSPLEAILHIQTALSEVQTPEQKRAALIEMAGGDDSGIPEDPEKAAKKFNEQKYCKYYIETELGIEGFSDASIKKYHSVVKHCEPEVIDVVLAGKINGYHAHTLRNESREKQLFALHTLEHDGEKAFLQIIKDIIDRENATKEKEKKKKTTRYSSASAYKQISAIGKVLQPEKEKLEDIVSSLGGESRAECDRFIKKLDRFLKELDEFVEQHS